jgi:competence protein ComEC
MENRIDFKFKSGSMRFEPLVPSTGDNVYISVVISNYEAEVLSKIVVDFFVDLNESRSFDLLEERIGNSQIISVLMPFDSASVECVWISPPPGNYNVFAQASMPEAFDHNNITISDSLVILDLLRITFIDVGQGDCIFVQFPDSRDKMNLLMDGGSFDFEDDLKARDFLLESGIKKIDFMVVSHADADHIRGLTQILRTIPVDKIYDPYSESFRDSLRTEKFFYDEFLSSIPDSTELLKITRGDRILANESLPDLTIEALNPPQNFLSSENDNILNSNSVVIKISYEKFSLLLTADADFAAENNLIVSCLHDINSDILKIGHHGSKYSTGSDFLDAVSPEIAVIQVSADNSYGHPSDEVLDLLEENNIEVYRTDLHGTIKVETNGKSYSVYVEKN